MIAHHHLDQLTRKLFRFLHFYFWSSVELMCFLILVWNCYRWFYFYVFIVIFKRFCVNDDEHHSNVKSSNKPYLSTLQQNYYTAQLVIKTVLSIDNAVIITAIHCLWSQKLISNWKIIEVWNLYTISNVRPIQNTFQQIWPTNSFPFFEIWIQL